MPKWEYNNAKASSMGSELLSKIGDTRDNRLMIQLTDGTEVNVIGLGAIIYDIAKKHYGSKG